MGPESRCWGKGYMRSIGVRVGVAVAQHTYKWFIHATRQLVVVVVLLLVVVLMVVNV